MPEVPAEILALRRRLAELEELVAAEQRREAAEPLDIDDMIRRRSGQGRGAGNASRTPSKETH